MSYDPIIPDDPLAQAKFMRDIESFTSGRAPMPSSPDARCPVCTYGPDETDEPGRCRVWPERETCPRRTDA